MTEESDTQQEEINSKDEISKIVQDLEGIKSEMGDLRKEIKEKNKTIEEQNKSIELLTNATIDLINIDMELISEELSSAERRLFTIGSTEQFDIIREVEKYKGVNMAFQKTKIYLEQGGHEAKLVIPTLNLIKITLEKISEKLKYTAEA